MVYLEKSLPPPLSLDKELAKAKAAKAKTIEESAQKGKIIAENDILSDVGDYGCDDVRERLEADFAGKCYICEDDTATKLVVEHFKPHHKGRFLNLKFSWENLFWACGHCNGLKLSGFDDILDCTKDIDIDKKIRIKLLTTPTTKVDILSTQEEEEVKNTVFLLERIYNAEKPMNAKIECQHLKKRILDELNKFKGLLIDFYENKEISMNSDVLKAHAEKVIHELKTSSAFTAFKRWIIRDDPSYLQDFPESEWNLAA
jgi:hypothetical protein